jgi:cyanophycinase
MRTIKPKGALFPIGGGEDKEHDQEVLKRIVKETGKKKPKICVITLATTEPEECLKTYIKAFRKLNIKKIVSLHYDLRANADTPGNLKCLKGSDIVFFSGGDQLRLNSLLNGTKLLKLIKARYFGEKKFVVAGTSAGATAMSSTMLVTGRSEDALIKQELELTSGLELVNDIIIDTHFTERARFGRLIQALAYSPGLMGIGLGEDTAICIKGAKMEIIGSGLVVIADGRSIEYTDMPDIRDGDPITVEGIRLHVLGPGKRFSMSDRKIIRPNRKS